MTATELQKELDNLADPVRAKNSAWFFKTYDGGYGAGDKFIGLRVPVIRTVCKKYRDLGLIEIEKLLESPKHEHRLAAVIIMAEQSKRGDTNKSKALFDLYLRRHDRINNWDLVDTGCPKIVGNYLVGKPHDILYKLARSKDIWERRTAIISTSAFINNEDLVDTFSIAQLLNTDSHDLIHKAVGWMLREAGKRDEAALKKFLDNYAANMPRTELRYALEKFSPRDKAHYMSLKSSSVK